MQRKECGGCGSLGLEVFLDLGTSPLADVYQPTARYPLQLAVCTDCWLVQLLEVVPGELLYNDAYGFRSSASPGLVAYHERYAAWLVEQVRPSFTVEIACNDGSLLRRLPGAKLGVEPSSAAHDARKLQLDVLGEPFTAQLAAQIRAGYGPANLIIANHVLAHVSDVADFAAGIRTLLDDDGIAVVEVQDFAALVLGNQIDHVYHQHRYYFTAATLAQTLSRAGLRVVHVQRTPAQGGSLRVIARKVERSAATRLPLPGFGSLDVYAGMQTRAELLRDRLLDLLEEERFAGRKVAGYAAAAKATTLLHWCGLTSADISYVVDATPGKIGKTMPGTDIPIVADGTPVDTYLLFAHNYLSSVLRREQRFTTNGGRWLVPIPTPVVI